MHTEHYRCVYVCVCVCVCMHGWILASYPGSQGKGSGGRKSLIHTACACTTLCQLSGILDIFCSWTVYYDVTKYLPYIISVYCIAVQQRADIRIHKGWIWIDLSLTHFRKTMIQLSLALFAKIVGNTIIHTHRNIQQITNSKKVSPLFLLGQINQRRDFQAQRLDKDDSQKQPQRMLKVSASQSYAVSMHQAIHMAMLFYISAHTPTRLTTYFGEAYKCPLTKRMLKQCVPGSFFPLPLIPPSKHLGTRLGLIQVLLVGAIICHTLTPSASVLKHGLGFGW